MTPATTANNNAKILTLNVNSDLEIKYFEPHELTKAIEYKMKRNTLLSVQTSTLMLTVLEKMTLYLFSKELLLFVLR